MPTTYEFPRLALSVDFIVFGLDDEDLMPYDLLDAIERVGIRDEHTLLEILGCI